MAADSIIDEAVPADLRPVQEQLRSQNHVLPHIPQGFSYDALVVSRAGQVRTVDLRRVEKGTAVPVGVLDGLNAVCLRGNLAVAVGKCHTAHADL